MSDTFISTTNRNNVTKTFSKWNIRNDIEDINSILLTGGFDYDSDKIIINKKYSYQI